MLQGPNGVTAVRPRGQPAIQHFSVDDPDLTLLDSLEQMHRSGAPIAVVSDNRDHGPPVQGIHYQSAVSRCVGRGD